MKRLALYLLIAVTLIGWAVADDWEALENRPVAGISVERWNHVLNHFREKPYTVAELQPCLAIVSAAAKQDLPVNGLWTLLEEGAVKQASPAVLLQHATRRLELLQQAQRLLAETGFAACDTAARHELADAIARALESSLTIAAVRRPLQAAAGHYTWRLKTAVEAGELLRLSGVDDDTVGALMEDFLLRGLRRGEILRATSRAIQQHRQGLRGEQIRAALWQTESSAPVGQHQHRHGR